ncbi:hypothetical protein HJD18_01560 [Thermoleophilia bacterium SCSIO 60948]|nr:hypothetical protein HJD18_01560 [Thermoleophilia bacterium SCSIO 60948]
MAAPAPLTRRKLLATGAAGSGAVVLSACGVQAPEASDSRDAELLDRSLAAERTVLAAYGGSSGAGAQESEQLSIFTRQVEEHISALEDLIADAGGEASSEESGGTGNGSGPEAAAAALSDAIATHRDVAGDLTSDRRAPVIGVMANDAQQLAVLNGLLGEEQAQFAFVTGGEETPLGEPSEEEYAEAESRSTLGAGPESSASSGSSDSAGEAEGG